MNFYVHVFAMALSDLAKNAVSDRFMIHCNGAS